MHMLTAQVLSAVFGAIATALLAALVRILAHLRHDVKRFMAVHLWLIAHAQWSSRTIQRILNELDMDNEPPPELPEPRQ